MLNFELKDYVKGTVDAQREQCLMDQILIMILLKPQRQVSLTSHVTRRGGFKRWRTPTPIRTKFLPISHGNIETTNIMQTVNQLPMCADNYVIIIIFS